MLGVEPAPLEIQVSAKLEEIRTGKSGVEPVHWLAGGELLPNRIRLHERSDRTDGNPQPCSRRVCSIAPMLVTSITFGATVGARIGPNKQRVQSETDRHGRWGPAVAPARAGAGSCSSSRCWNA